MPTNLKIIFYISALVAFITQPFIKIYHYITGADSSSDHQNDLPSNHDVMPNEDSTELDQNHHIYQPGEEGYTQNKFDPNS